MKIAVPLAKKILAPLGITTLGMKKQDLWKNKKWKDY